MAASSPPDPVRWAQVNRLFEVAITRPPDERATFLAAQCGSDLSLRAEVESLLAAHRDEDTSVHPGVVVGSRLGDYEVTGFIAAGGMGEVYRARDAKLGRDVALKILPAAFVADPDRRARFEREARLLASLNHPHIATIHGFVEQAGTSALVLELVEGDTLADRIARGPIPLDEALPIARQIAEALEAAHEQGIIHRDLKPANIKVTPDGVVKVLDFGLAKLIDPGFGTRDSGSGGATTPQMSPTITSPAMMTGVGVLLGTAAYMSPEQAKGREADKRSDVWAFGCVLYEMLTGRRAFEGDDVTDMLAAVLRAEPDWSRFPGDVPPPVRTLMESCLVKDARRRVADISIASFVLDKAASLTWATTAVPVTTAAPVKPLARRAALAVAALLIGATGASAIIFSFVVPRPSPQPVTRLAIAAPADAPVAYDAALRALAVAPDGSKVAYTSANVSRYSSRGTPVRLLVRALDQLQPIVIAGPGDIREPFFSPDGEWIGFLDPPERLQKVPSAGGPPTVIKTLDGASRGVTWGSDGTLVYATGNQTTGLQRISTDGGEPEILTRPNRTKGERDHLWPHFLPGGQAVLFTITPMAGSIDDAQIAVLDLRDGSQKVLLSGGSDARYVGGGYLVYGTAGTLRAVAFDLDRLEVRGTPVSVAQQVLTSGWANFDVAANGTLAYMTDDVTRLTLVWVDRTGREQPLGVPQRNYSSAQLSPDGTRVALYIRDQQDDIWIWNLARETLQRLTFDPGGNAGGVWTPDGRRIAFSQALDGRGEIHWQAADGSGRAEPLTKGSARSFQPTDILPDGSAVLYETTGDPMDIWMARIAGSQPSTGKALLAGPGAKRAGTVSPDGRWLAYQSDESGRYEVYVRPFPEVETGRWQISTAGGTRPRWSRDGRELFYIVDGAPLAVMSVSLTAGSTFAAGSPVKVIEGDYVVPNGPRLAYDVSPDGKRFLMIKNAEAQGEATRPQIVVVQHWLEELKRLVPSN